MPNDPLALSSPDKTVVQAETRKAIVERSIDTWMQKETKENPTNNAQIQSVFKMLKEKINFTSGVIEGNLDLRDYTGLTSLPDNLTVDGNLYLNSCISLVSLPENLTVSRNLYLSGCTNLESLPNNLTVSGDLNLSGCTILKSLSDNLTVGGNLTLCNCINLASLPENLTVSRNLYLSGCTRLTFMPDDLTVGENLDFRDCTTMTRLPDNLAVGGNLDLRGCAILTHLSCDLTTVGGNLYLNSCIDLVSLSENLTVGRNLYLSGCTHLTFMPENLTVGENLDFRDCINLSHLPDNLSVGGNLDLRGCINLTFLPDNFTVGGNLDLRGLINLTSLPDNLTVDGDLNLGGCTSLTSLPNNITSMGVTMRGRVRQVNLEGCGLSLETIQKLQQIQNDGSAPGMQFIFSMPVAHSQITFSSIAEGFDCWNKLTYVENSTCPNLDKLTPDEASNLCRFLTRLIDTAEYKNVNTRQGLARRVLYFLAEIEKNEELRKVACQLIYDGLTTGNDLTISTLDNIDLLMLISAAEKEVIDSNDASGTALKVLAKQIIMLEKVDKAANEHIKSLPFVDPIEVQMAFRLRLREKLDLPISTQHMIFRNYDNITDEEIDAAGDKILQEYNESELEIFLNLWSPWKRH